MKKGVKLIISKKLWYHNW